MSSTTRDAAAPAMLRFDRVERFAHWANAVLFLTLMATALPLYFPSVEQFVGRRALVEEIHLWAGLSLPIPLAISLAGPWGARLRRDLRRLGVWSREELRAVKTLGRDRITRPDKFNPGQKFNAIFTLSAGTVMLGTGAMLKWFQPFSDSVRTGATFVHDVGAYAVFTVVTGHILFALTHPSALKSMFTGRIPRRWAERHAAGWVEEEDASLRRPAARSAVPAP